jgi:uncharacterized protein YndB with AHSA1/START domain
MSTTRESTVVRLEIAVDVPVEHAFRVFTEEFDKIKPREHNMLVVEIAETVFERHVGGKIYDRGVDGSVCQWARVLAFDPPDRVVIAWDISPQFQLETDPSRASEVEVSFTAQGPESTLVLLEHRHLDRHGEGWESAYHGLAADDGWPLYLDRFRQVTQETR